MVLELQAFRAERIRMFLELVWHFDWQVRAHVVRGVWGQRAVHAEVRILHCLFKRFLLLDPCSQKAQASQELRLVVLGVKAKRV